jgi:accessory gene regulator protein AgrB
MGTGIVYWLMILNILTAAGWIFLTINNARRHRKAFVLGCLVMCIYFLVVAFIQFNSYIILRTPIINTLIAIRYIAGFMGLFSTGLFVTCINLYESQ